MFNCPVYDARLENFAGFLMLLIKDRYDPAQPTMTVTNGAAWVLSQIAAELDALPPLILYRDSTGVWTKMRVTDDGKFCGFRPIAPHHEQPIMDIKTARELAVLHYAYGIAV